MSYPMSSNSVLLLLQRGTVVRHVHVGLEPVAHDVKVHHAEAVLAEEARVGGRQGVVERDTLGGLMLAEVTSPQTVRPVAQAQGVEGAEGRVRGVDPTHVTDLKC